MSISKGLLCAAALLGFSASPSFAAPKILFVGNSLDFADWGYARYYKADTVTDLNGKAANGKTQSGTPGLFKQFAREAGLDYDVYLETLPGQGLDAHLKTKRELLDKPWDIVVMHGYTTLDQKNPGDPALLYSTSKEMTEMLRKQNPKVVIYLSSTYSRPDTTYPTGQHWNGQPIQQMAKDVLAAYVEVAKQNNIPQANIIPLGGAFNRAIDTGFADANPYDGVEAGKHDLWAWDHYHSSNMGYYIHALVDFGKITGKDPLSLGANEEVAEDMGFSPDEATAMQKIAHDTLADQQQASAR